MEKTNKYYGIIEDLVKNHRKFSGYEAILEDIIDDVFSHSEVIINTVNNDSVVLAYLEKVVSTSIITVPKKMGFHSEIRHKVISSTDILPPPRANKDLVDKMINSAPKEATVNTTEKQELEFVEEIIADNDIASFEELILDDNNIEEVEVIAEDGTQFVDENLEPAEEQEDLDKEIEVVEEIEEELEVSNVEELTLEIGDVQEFAEKIEDYTANDISDANLEEVVDFADNLNVQEFEQVDLNEENLSLELEEVSETEEFETVEELVDSADMSEDVVEEDVVEENLLEQPEAISLDETFVIDEQLTESLDVIEVVDEIANTANEEELILEQDSTSLLEEEPQELDMLMETPIEENLAQEHEESSKIDYSIFDYTPVVEFQDFDVEEFTKDLEDLDAKRPELNIIKIYNLKYKENKSVEQIVSNLEMNEAEVLEALNEIITIV